MQILKIRMDKEEIKCISVQTLNRIYAKKKSVLKFVHVMERWLHLKMYLVFASFT